jgi:hypothetical protein
MNDEKGHSINYLKAYLALEQKVTTLLLGSHQNYKTINEKLC